MRRWVRSVRALMLSALVLGIGMQAAQAQSLTTVTVMIAGFRNVEGVALVTLYDSEQNWLKMPKAVQVVRAPLKGSELRIDFKDVKPGTYALQVVHDENKNNKLDMRWLPYPKPIEGVGVSNDPDNKAGAPKWEAAKFDVGPAPASIKVTVRYVE
ncbi:MAG: DUF2141 domain-containing protein [Polyangiales bacterium]